MIYAKIDNGQIIMYAKGFKPDGNFVEVPEKVFFNLEGYVFRDGTFVEKPLVEVEAQNEAISKTIADRIEELEQLVADIASIQLGVE